MNNRVTDQVSDTLKTAANIDPQQYMKKLFSEVNVKD